MSTFDDFSAAASSIPPGTLDEVELSIPYDELPAADSLVPFCALPAATTTALAIPSCTLPAAASSSPLVEPAEVEAFIADNDVDERAAASFRSQAPIVLRVVMGLGGLTSSTNTSASLMGRIKKAKERVDQVKIEVASQVGEFLANEPDVDERAGALLRAQEPHVQLVVMDRGTLATSSNPSKSLMGRIRKAQEPGGSHSRLSVYTMGHPRVTPQVNAMRKVEAATMSPLPMISATTTSAATMIIPQVNTAATSPTPSAPLHNSISPTMMPTNPLTGGFGSVGAQGSLGTLSGYGSGLMGAGLASAAGSMAITQTTNLFPGSVLGAPALASMGQTDILSGAAATAACLPGGFDFMSGAAAGCLAGIGGLGTVAGSGVVPGSSFGFGQGNPLQPSVLYGAMTSPTAAGTARFAPY